MQETFSMNQVIILSLTISFEKSVLENKPDVSI